MPEGPEVAITAKGLRDELKGLKINHINITEASRYHKYGMENYETLAYPIYVNDIYPRGKKIIIDCIDKYKKKVIFVSALAMEGSWKLYTGKHAGVELITATKTLFFHDTRHFGTFDICLSEEEYKFVMKSVGPDLLNEDVSFEVYSKVISKESLKHKEICWFMMEQKYFSGVGNYLLAEILYACKILPTRLLQNLTDKDRYNLWFQSRKLLKESFESGGLTIATYFAMTGEKGVFDTKVYGKEYDPFGNPVYKAVFSNKRTSHYVPAIQN